MASGTGQAWHATSRHRQNVSDFHQNYSRFPKRAIASAMEHHMKTMRTIFGDLRHNGQAQFLEYTGSAYEGIKVPSTDVEFDVMVVLPGGKHITVNGTQPLYANLSSESAMHAKVINPSTKCIMPQRVTNEFQGQLQKVLNNHPELETTVKLREHGPAIQMDVYKTPAQRELFYSVDMVPAYHVSNGQYYIAKPSKDGDQPAADDMRTSWRQSFSLQEKAYLKNIDAGNKCHKQCMRMLKVQRDFEPGLRNINSYIIKTTMMNLSRDENLDWGQKNMGQRSMDTMKYLQNALESNYLPHHFEPRVNLLDKISSVNRENMRDRLQELLRSEQKFYPLITRGSTGAGRVHHPRAQIHNRAWTGEDDGCGILQVVAAIIFIILYVFICAIMRQAPCRASCNKLSYACQEMVRGCHSNCNQADKECHTACNQPQSEGYTRCEQFYAVCHSICMEENQKCNYLLHEAGKVVDYLKNLDQRRMKTV